MKNKKEVQWRFLLFSIIIVVLVASVGSLFTRDAVNSDWYLDNKPTIAPPNYVFPIAWTVIYVLIALSLYLVFVSKKSKDRKILIKLFIINLMFNLLWSVFFFGMRLPLLSFADLLLMWITIIGILTYSQRVDKKVTYIMIPYFLWVSFAGVLNYLFI